MRRDCEAAGLVLDGIYPHGGAGAAFVEVPPPTDDDVQVVRHRIVGRIPKMLPRRGALVEAPDWPVGWLRVA